MVNKAYSLTRLLLDGLLPQYCVLCGAFSHSALPLCEDCRSELPPNDSACPCCALPLPAGLPLTTCGRCLQRQPAFSRAVVPLLYGEYLAYLIKQWKYRGQQRLSPLLAALWLAHARVEVPDLIVPMPMHWRRQLWRGYNQAELLARALTLQGARLGRARIESRLLTRNRATPPQSGRNARERAGNLRGAFTVTRRCDSLRIALVDDVMTTGASADAAASSLMDAGADSVELWCLARTPMD